MTPVRIGGLAAGADAAVDPRDAVAALEVIDAARVSAARAEVVRLG